MKAAGLLMLIAGWGIVVAAIALLASTASRSAFVIAGLAVEVIGFVLVARSHFSAEAQTE